MHNGLRCTKRGVIRLDAAFEIRTCYSRLRAKNDLLENGSFMWVIMSKVLY